MRGRSWATLLALGAIGLLSVLVPGAGGAVTSVVLVSVDSDEVEANAGSFTPALSGNGRYVAFASDATNLAGADPAPARRDIFVRDLQTGTTERITAGNGNSERPSISDDGRRVAFESAATDIAAPDTNSRNDVFVYDRDTDTATRITHGNANSHDAAVSGDGNFVAFKSFATDLPAAATGVGDVFRWERATGTMVKVSVSSGGAAGNDQSSQPWISDNGSVIAFTSRATNLIADDANASWDAFVRDVAAGTTAAASVSTAGILAEATFFGSSAAGISGNGRYVTFTSSATNLVAGVSQTQVYLRDRTLGTTTYVSAGNGTSGGSGPAPVTDDGHVAFVSFAALVAGDTNFRSDVYFASVAQRVSLTAALGQGEAVDSSNGAGSPSIDGDGTLVVVQNTFDNVPSAASTTRPNVVAYELSTSTGGGGGSPPPEDEDDPRDEAIGAPRLVVEPSFTLPADSAGFRPGETIDVSVTVTNTGDAPANAVRLDIVAFAIRPSSQVSTDVIVVQGILASGCRFIGRTTEICSFDGGLAPGESREVKFVLPATASGDDRRFTRAGFQAKSAETQSDFETIDFPPGPAKQADCGPGETCPTSDGADNRACIDTHCFFGGGPDTFVCTAGSVCSGGFGNDRYTCSGIDTVCSGGAGEDLGACRAEATCKEDAGDDVLACIRTSDCAAGAGDDRLLCRFTDCLAGRGADFLRCDRSTCGAGQGNDTIRGGSGGETIVAGPGRDTVIAGAGNDTVNVADGEKDVVNCGSGRDTVIVDDEDDPRDCETILGADVGAEMWVSISFFDKSGRRGRSPNEDGPTTLGFNVRYFNRGPATATNVRLTLIVTATGARLRGFGLKSPPECSGVRTESGGASGTRHFVRCVFPSLNPGQDGTLTLAIFGASGSIVGLGNVEISAAEPDHRPSNNEQFRTSAPAVDEEDEEEEEDE